jgi:hypothetical protein
MVEPISLDYGDQLPFHNGVFSLLPSFQFQVILRSLSKNTRKNL